MTVAVSSTTAAPGTGSLTRVPFGIVTVYCGEQAGLDCCLISRFVYPYCVMFIPLCRRDAASGGALPDMPRCNFNYDS
jgi:hypothetical protein